MSDMSEGWEAIAARFMAVRSDVNANLVRSWERRNLRSGAAIVDVGCGSGMPIAQALVDDGFRVYGIDASPTLIAAFRQQFPALPAACELAQDSRSFGGGFDAAVSFGMLFLLSRDDQRRVVERVATALVPDGRFLFSARRETCEWKDRLTGRRSRSLGEDGYRLLLDVAGFCPAGCSSDEGGNAYYDAVRTE